MLNTSHDFTVTEFSASGHMSFLRGLWDLFFDSLKQFFINCGWLQRFLFGTWHPQLSPDLIADQCFLLSLPLLFSPWSWGILVEFELTSLSLSTSTAVLSLLLSFMPAPSHPAHTDLTSASGSSQFVLSNPVLSTEGCSLRPTSTVLTACIF